MRRDDMKIIEFEMDGDPRPMRRSAGSGQMKIIETDDEKEKARPRPLTGKDVGHIKILEFDDDPHERGRGKASAPPVVPRPMKIVEFDEEGSRTGNAAGSPRMKIKEFD